MSKQILVEAVNKCMSFIPDKMDKNEGRNLMTLLYETGFVSDYLDALDAADENGLCEDDEEVKFSDYFDFDSDSDIKIDSKTGKITFLSLIRTIDDGDDDDDDDDNDDEWCEPYDLPSMIERFDSLESIRLCNCQCIPIELGNLLQLKAIAFQVCRKAFFENIPEGLHLPSSTKKVYIQFSELFKYSSLSSFMKIIPPQLEALAFNGATSTEQKDEIVRILQSNDLIFCQSLTKLEMKYGLLNEDDLELLLFEIRSNFPKLRTIIVGANNIKSLRGIEARIKRLSSASASALPSSSSSSRTKLSSNNNLCKIVLNANPIERDVIIQKDNSIDQKEKAAVLTFLDAFDGISSLGINSTYVGTYNPDIEYLLRRNKVNLKYINTTPSTTTEKGTISGGSSNATILNRSLWPLIFERAYKKSYEIYNFSKYKTQGETDRMICATGLFELVRHGPFFAEGHPLQYQYHDDSNRKKTTTITTTTTTTTTNYDNGNNNNNALKRKRSTYSS